jgi:hypothetical protein
LSWKEKDQKEVGPSVAFFALLYESPLKDCGKSRKKTLFFGGLLSGS